MCPWMGGEQGIYTKMEKIPLKLGFTGSGIWDMPELWEGGFISGVTSELKL